MMDKTDKIIIYTDGSALNNGSPDSGCGWAAKLIYNGKYRLKSGGCRGKTNNQMEMLAVLNALKCITDRSLPVVLYSDSKYVIETLKGTYRVGKNVELWNEILALYKQFADISPIWVKGHNGNIHNEQVDGLAVEESKKWQ
ncbi:ribonuclease H family protein [Enterocloster bolteae]|jgi:ribonuclease HI|uniref:ribonuclease H family protein n=1 Tax=Enterocloster bolteae TaxID=208479 RepID=UPI0015AE4903|nr:RNase H family protein [Enterocloster bolteae]MDU3289873.1 ribonuclease H [Enterocloster bolteae]